LTATLAAAGKYKRFFVQLITLRDRRRFAKIKKRLPGTAQPFLGESGDSNLFDGRLRSFLRRKVQAVRDAAGGLNGHPFFDGVAVQA
jgi:hypothetical protein